MEWEAGELHSQDGLFFKRTEDGSVRIRIFEDAKPENGKLTFETTIPASAWASIVASSCARDETGETHAEALEFHNKPPA